VPGSRPKTAAVYGNRFATAPMKATAFDPPELGT
jgi:hypothetical protein